MHEGSKSEREERYQLCMKKLNAFEMFPHEKANDTYSRLNVLVEEINSLGLTKISPTDVIRKILSFLPSKKYANIVTYFHQQDLALFTPSGVMGKVNAHESYMKIAPDQASSFPKKKDIAFKASKSKEVIKKESSDDEASEDEDESIARLARKTKKMLNKLNNRGVNFDSKKKKFFTSDKKKSLKNMKCFNCNERVI